MRQKLIPLSRRNTFHLAKNLYSFVPRPSGSTLASPDAYSNCSPVSVFGILSSGWIIWLSDAADGWLTTGIWACEMRRENIATCRSRNFNCWPTILLTLWLVFKSVQRFMIYDENFVSLDLESTNVHFWLIWSWLLTVLSPCNSGQWSWEMEWLLDKMNW